jgi:capsid protein
MIASLKSFVNRLRPGGRFGYDALAEKGRRQTSRSATHSEDAILTRAGRTKAQATTRDLIRNITIAGWMVRCHLDYVSRFSFQARTGDDALDDQIERLVERDSLRTNFDVRGRLSRSKAARMMEARRVLDGEIFIAKLSSGRVQLIEADRVRQPTMAPEGVDLAAYREGLRVSPGGRLQSAIVCKRGPDGIGYEFERAISAMNLWQHAYWDTTYRVDQLRGISPLMPAINLLQDTYEGVDLALAKAKIAQMFGLIFFRKAVDDAEGWQHEREQTADADNDGLDDETGEAAADEDRYKVDPGMGPFKLELDPEDDAKFLSTNTPETELIEALRFVVDLALKGLDIPSSFWDPRAVNYYSRKADIQQYENSAATKRDDNKQLWDEWTAWRLRLHILAGELVLPGAMTLEDVRWEWIPAAMPWVDKLRDVKADELALNIGQDSRVRIARRNGQDAYDLAREEMDYEEWIIAERRRRNLPPTNGPVPVGTTDNEGKADENA